MLCNSSLLHLFPCSRVSPRPPLGLRTFRRTRKDSQDSVLSLLMAMTYYSRRIKSKISKGKRSMGQRKPGTSFQGLLPGESHRTRSFSPGISWAMTTHVKDCLLGMLGRDLAPWAVSGAGHVALPGTYQKSRLPEGKSGVEHKPYDLYKHFRHCDLFLSESGGNSPES